MTIDSRTKLPKLYPIPNPSAVSICSKFIGQDFSKVNLPAVILEPNS